jgi:hypothetical protein
MIQILLKMFSFRSSSKSKTTLSKPRNKSFLNYYLAINSNSVERKVGKRVEKS